jgi:hypothetical protein
MTRLRSKSAVGAILMLAGHTAYAGWDSAIAAIRGEPQVVDLVRKGPILYVGMLNDGSRRDGYAQYLCEVLREQRVDGRSVDIHIIDIAVLNATSEWKKMGSNVCRLPR